MSARKSSFERIVNVLFGSPTYGRKEMSRHRRLGFEALENRKLLSVSPLLPSTFSSFSSQSALTMEDECCFRLLGVSGHEPVGYITGSCDGGSDIPSGIVLQSSYNQASITLQANEFYKGDFNVTISNDTYWSDFDVYWIGNNQTETWTWTIPDGVSLDEDERT